MILTEADIRSPLWKRLEEHFTARLESLRRENDGDLEPIKTAKKRGQIEEVKYILRLAEPSIPAQTPPIE